MASAAAELPAGACTPPECTGRALRAIETDRGERCAVLRFQRDKNTAEAGRRLTDLPPTCRCRRINASRILAFPRQAVYYCWRMGLCSEKTARISMADPRAALRGDLTGGDGQLCNVFESFAGGTRRCSRSKSCWRTVRSMPQ